ncbi:hypothetical protein EDEG_01389 [Edhazardia aedis USNM 41457]|uniref:mRNA cap guanine-N(7) methyltransferase n=1 Tax=Edhazardia aedis (strain USNM 41457) TaxID=1003232 RepID=J9DA32_EDHAE|nr:hypothetical protein EDEG_01389 [Edhazardia aedis USNM 41457]|eukprot:EJW04374.1 hypothetical protein EDEG_01389 [Edhazardia aedis USNM 41457]
MDNRDEIAEHYNQAKGISVVGRNLSKIINIRNMNNYIKSILINEFTKENAAVLDLGCGRGGDLRKYKNQNIKYYHGIDIAEKSIEAARERVQKLYPSFIVKFSAKDAYGTDWDLKQTFDVISCQFSFHYAFKTKEIFENTVKNISGHLNKNGSFIATIPNTNVVLGRYGRYGNNYGNQFYRIEFLEKYEDIVKKSELFGVGYNFYLEEAIDNCIEYLIDIKAMIKMFEKYGLKMVLYQDFLQFYNSLCGKYQDLHEIIIKKRLSIDEQKVIELYSVIVFEKL